LKAFVSLLLAAACLLALPGVASATTYTVNSTGDAPDNGAPNGVCETATPGECTLRAAIKESNSFIGAPDEIAFAPAFNGQAADTITALTLLPAITDPVAIKGGSCTQLGQAGPCAGVDAPGLSYALTVENADGVAIEGLAVTGGLTGIRVVNSSQNFVARNDWLGVKLEGGAGVGANTGIWLDPNSNGATIGGTAATERNVFANSAAEGLDIEGADNADVLGNYFGVKPDGSTQAANGKNIEITDTVAFAATGNEVGTTVAVGAAPCDGGCNVISGASSMGIDLQGNGAGQNEEPATGPTTIHGNYVGLNAAGTATAANILYGIYVGEAGDALVGGPANEDANYVAGGGEGVAISNAEGFEAIGNVFGSGAAGAEITAPGKGVFALTTNNSNPVAISSNVFDMDGGIGIQVNFGGAEIRSNFIEGAELGVWTKVGPNAAGGNVIEDNVIGESIANGIRIEDKQNMVLGNAVYKSADSGILLELPVPLLFPTENVIGGNAATDENNINESGGPAIEIVDNSGNTEEDSLNEVRRNRGAKNAGLFIDLVGAANAGILPPAFATAQQSSASGSGAEPGATIRVFRKGTAEAGEIESFLEETTADGSGNWKVTYPSIPAGTIVAATQTSVAGGTSELAMATASADSSGGGGGSGGGKGGDGGGGGKGPVTCQPLKPGKCSPGPDTKAPQTKILKGPRGKVSTATVKFKFSSSEKGSSFRCKLDRGPFRVCKSPKKYRNLKPGKHVFKVRAVDRAGNIDPTAAKRAFRIVS
jgi:CSLREA domain-containing protein